MQPVTDTTKKQTKKSQKHWNGHTGRCIWAGTQLRWQIEIVAVRHTHIMSTLHIQPQQTCCYEKGQCEIFYDWQKDMHNQALKHINVFISLMVCSAFHCKLSATCCSVLYIFVGLLSLQLPQIESHAVNFVNDWQTYTNDIFVSNIDQSAFKDLKDLQLNEHCSRWSV